MNEFFYRLSTWIRVKENLFLPVHQRNLSDVQLTLQLLREVPFFSRLGDSDLQVVADMLIVQVVPTGHIILEKKSADTLTCHLDYAMSGQAMSTSGSDSLALRAMCWSSVDVVLGESSGQRSPRMRSDVDSDHFTQLVIAQGTSRHNKLSSNSHCLCPNGDHDHVGPAHGEFCSTDMSVLAYGKLLLYVPTQHDSVSFVQHPGDIVYHAITWNVLPKGSRVVALETSFLLKFSPRPNIFINRVLRCCEMVALANKVNFLRYSLRENIFEGCSHHELLMCARELLPVRLNTDDTLMSEDEPAECLFFVIDGSAAITRRYRGRKPQSDESGERARSTYFNLTPEAEVFSHGTASVRKPTRSCSYVRKLRPASSVRYDFDDKLSLLDELFTIVSCPVPIATSPPRIVFKKSRIPQIEVATVTAGDFVGELELLSHNPDSTDGADAMWSENYWRRQLLTRCSDLYTTSKLQQNDAKTCASRDGYADTDEVVGVCDCANHVTQDTHRDAGQTGSGDEASAASGYTPAALRAQATRRFASVRAISPLYMYRLSFDACRTLLPARCVERLTQHAKSYFAYSEFIKEYERKLRWAECRREEVAKALKMSIAAGTR